MPKVKIVEINSEEDLEQVIKEIARRKECKKDVERGEDDANARYDRFINIVFDLCECVLEDGKFTRDCEALKEHLHEAPLMIKKSFFANFSKMSSEIIEDIMGITAEFAVISKLKRILSDDKREDKKVEDIAQTKKEKKSTSTKKK